MVANDAPKDPSSLEVQLAKTGWVRENNPAYQTVLGLIHNAQDVGNTLAQQFPNVSPDTGSTVKGSAGLTQSITNLINSLNKLLTNPVFVSPALIQTTKVTLTDAQIKALPAGDFTLITGVTDKVIRPLYVDAVLTIATTGKYTNIDVNGYLNIHTKDWQTELFSYLLNGNTTGQTRLNDFLGINNQKAIWRPPLFVSGSAADGTAFDNDWGLQLGLIDFNSAKGQDLVLGCSNPAGNFTGGDASNTMEITIAYRML